MKLAYREAIRAAMRKALHDDPRVLLELKIYPPQKRPCCLFPITFRRLIRRWFCRRCHCAGATT